MRTKHLLLLFLFIYLIFFLVVLMVDFQKPNIDGSTSEDFHISTIFPHYSHSEVAGECGFVLHSMYMHNRPLLYYFEVVRPKNDEIVFIFSPDLLGAMATHNVGLPKKSVIEFIKFENDEEKNNVKDRVKSTCKEVRFTLEFGVDTRYVAGVMPAMIYNCQIPSEFASKHNTFHISLDCDRKDRKYFVQDCRSETQEKRTKFSATVLANNPKEEIALWVKYMHFIGVEKVNLFLHNPIPSRLAFFSRHYDPSFLRVIPVVENNLYRSIQTIVLADGVYRNPSEWTLSNDVDEFPVFMPNLEEYVKTVPKDLSASSLSNVMFGSTESGKNLLLSVHNYSPTVKVIPRCDREKTIFYEERTKPIFRPETVYNVENHFVCPREGYKVYSTDISDAFLGHFYEKPGRTLPKPYKFSSVQDQDPIIFGEMKGCYYETIDRTISRGMKELMRRYGEILDSCDSLLCEKNEMELRDPELIQIKNYLKVKTEKSVKEGFTEKEVSQFHESIVAHCRYTHENSKLFRDFDEWCKTNHGNPQCE